LYVIYEIDATYVLLHMREEVGETNVLQIKEEVRMALFYTAAGCMDR
jgi:hypothetical protein